MSEANNMSTSNEVAAMRLALEALKIAQNNLAPSKHSAHAFGDGELWDMYADAIKALEAALEAHKALAQSRSDVKQEQRSDSEHTGEPVAWLQIGVGPLHEGDVIARTTKPKEWNPEWWRFEPLYTTPYVATQRQQRPSRSDIKPLTDEQIDDVIWRSHKVESNYAGWVTDQRRIWARAIEAAHGIRPSDFKEKNNGS